MADIQLTEQEKSLKLAAMVGWETDEVFGEKMILVNDFALKSLYQDWCLFAAWKVLNWAVAQPDIGTEFVLWFEFESHLWRLYPREAATKILDKVLELASDE